jgi:hypothetical protein
LIAVAPSEDHIVPGHDPLVMQLYPAPSRELEGIVVALDEEPKPLPASARGPTGH